MYINSGYLGNTRLDRKDRSKPLIVTSCGTYRLIHRESLPTWRPHGRVDFQLLYVASGAAHFFLNGEDVKVSAGSMVLYRPREEQHYIYYLKDSPEVFWVHFTGSDVTNILRGYGFEKGVHVIPAGSLTDYRRIYEDMIYELQQNPPDSGRRLALMLEELFILVHRQQFEQPGRRDMDAAIRRIMEESVRDFNARYITNIRIDEYAASRGMSVSAFIRAFRACTGETPKQYILSLRLRNACSLLRDPDYNISEAASTVGFDNALYFSRCFRKHMGMSPSEYRRHH